MIEDLDDLTASGMRFSAILADPPWQLKVYSGKGKSRSAERHCDCMSPDDIKALPVGELAADDCALFLSTTWPTLPEALEVIGAWAFTYKTVGLVWVKQNRTGEGLFMGLG